MKEYKKVLETYQKFSGSDKISYTNSTDKSTADAILAKRQVAEAIAGGTSVDDVNINAPTTATSYTLSASEKVVEEKVQEYEEPAVTTETWYFNKYIKGHSYNFTFNFTSNNIKYYRISMVLGSSSSWDLLYKINNPPTYTIVNTYNIDEGSPRWYNQAYRTIILDEPATGDLLTFLQANATKIS